MTEQKKPGECKDGGKSAPPSLSEEDTSLFRAAIGDARPLPDSGKTLFTPQRPRPAPRQSRLHDQPALTDSLSDHIPLALSETDGEFSFLRPGMALPTLKKLRRGHWNIQAEIDLHGMTSDEARASFSEFLEESKSLGLRCVRIIHGKGFGSRNQEPVLKLKVASWLMQRDDTLAFCQARPIEGGSGATIVLLRKAF
ncbi:MAG: Smr/MutS family protein [Betaproteobacteria bacterium]|nr:Smr/MutS family protein [Betaproteobacteria bacterium]